MEKKKRGGKGTTNSSGRRSKFLKGDRKGKKGGKKRAL